MNDNGLSGATLVVSQTIAMWTVLIPPVSEVRKATPSSDIGNDVHHSEMIIVGVSGAVAVVMGTLEKSVTPVVVSAVLLATLIGSYEYTLRKPGYSATS